MFVGEKVHEHYGWFCCIERSFEMAKHIQEGQCVVVGYHFDDDPPAFKNLPPMYRLWCLTHQCPDRLDHDTDG